MLDLEWIPGPSSKRRELASRVRALMRSRKHLKMATLRADGSPQISGTEIEFADGQMRIGKTERE
jgi:hypothetical protein